MKMTSALFGVRLMRSPQLILLPLRQTIVANCGAMADWTLTGAGMGDGVVPTGAAWSKAAGFLLLIVLGVGCSGGGSTSRKEAMSSSFLHFTVRSYWKGFTTLITAGFLIPQTLIETSLPGSNLLKFMLGLQCFVVRTSIIVHGQTQLTLRTASNCRLQPSKVTLFLT